MPTYLAPVLALLLLTGCAPTITDSFQEEPETPSSPVVVVTAPTDEGTGGSAPFVPCSDNADPTGCPAPSDECHAVTCQMYECVQVLIEGCS